MGSARAESPGKQVSESRHCSEELSSFWEHGAWVTQVHDSALQNTGCASFLLWDALGCLKFVVDSNTLIHE